MSSDGEPLTPVQVEALRARLLERTAEVEEGLAAAAEEAKPVGLDLAIGRLTRMDAMQAQRLAASRRQRLVAQREQVAQARARLDRGEFGDCARCEEPIGFARLMARPETPLCLRCQQEAGA